MTTHTTTPSPVRDAWDAIADGYDRYTTPHTIAFGTRLLEELELRPGVRVLDVGAGSGGLSIPAARRGAEVTAVDIAPTMIERLEARGRAEGLRSLQGQVGNGEQLDFPDATFDVAVSLNGVSVFPDLSAGVREMARVTRPGGSVLVAALGPLSKVEFVGFFLAAVRAVLPEAGPPQDEPLPPFRLSEPGAMQQTLAAAGLHDVRVESALWQTPFASADEFLATVLSSNPIARQLTADLTEEPLGQLRQVLDGMLRERSGGGPGAVLHTEIRIGRGIA